MIKNFKIQQLNENYRNSESEVSLFEYVKTESQNDPNFFSWLFDDDSLEDLSDLSLEQFNEFDQMLDDIALAEFNPVCEVHLGLSKAGRGVWDIDVIDKDGFIHESYEKVNAGSRSEAEAKARELHECDKVIFDY